MLKKIIKYSPGIIIPLAINFLVTLLYAAYLKPGQYGILNIYLNTIHIIYSLTLSIFQNASLRFYTLNEYETEEEFLSTYLFANVFATVVTMIPCVITSIFLNFNWEVIVISIGANGLFLFISNFYRVKFESRNYNKMRILASVITLVLLLFFAYKIQPLTYIWPLVAIYGTYMTISLIEIVHLRKKISIKHISYNLLIKSIKYGVPLVGVALLGNIIASSDQYFLLYFLGDNAVGNYALGHRMVEAVLNNLLMMILLVMTPELNAVHDGRGEKESKDVLKKMIDIAMWIILPFTLAIIVYSKYIINFFFPDYTNAVTIMRLVVFASVFNGISMFTCKGLELAKKPKYILYSLIVSAIINCGYNSIFIKVYGITASAHSSILSYMVYNILLVFFTKRYYDIKIDYIYIIRTIFATAITFFIAVLILKIWFVKNVMILSIQLGIVILIYFLLSLILNLYDSFK